MAMLLVQQYLDEMGYSSGEHAHHVSLYLLNFFLSFDVPEQVCILCSSP